MILVDWIQLVTKYGCMTNRAVIGKIGFIALNRKFEKRVTTTEIVRLPVLKTLSCLSTVLGSPFSMTYRIGMPSIR